MRGNVPSKQMIAPKKLSRALELLNDEPGKWKPFAGGTDLMVLFEAGVLKETHFMSLWNLKELRGIEADETGISIGALATYAEIMENKIIQKEFPMLVEASRVTGAAAIQNRGTLAGNIANGSPAADSPPALLAYGASVQLSSIDGSRWVDYSTFHTGYKKSLLSPHELITQVRLMRGELSKKARHYYRKVGTRKAQAISKVCFAGVLDLDGKTVKHVQIGLGSVAPLPLRCVRTEAVIQGQKLTADVVSKAKAAFVSEITPIDDVRSTRKYRVEVAANLLEDFLCGTGTKS